MNTGVLAMRSFAVLAVTLTSLLFAWGQDAPKKDPQKTTSDKKRLENLDTKNINVTALYLHKTSVRLAEIENESEKDKQPIRYSAAVLLLETELKDWVGVNVEWPLQVESINHDEPGYRGVKPAIRIVSNYAYKNKSQLWVAVCDEKMLGNRYQFVTGVVGDGSGIAGSGAIGSSYSNVAEYDSIWASNLKKGQLIQADATIVAVTIPSNGKAPTVVLKVSKYSPYIRK